MVRSQGETQKTQEPWVLQLVALEKVADRVLRKVVEEERQHVSEGRRTTAAQVRLDLGHVHEQAWQELVCRVGQQMEHTHDRG